MWQRSHWAHLWGKLHVPKGQKVFSLFAPYIANPPTKLVWHRAWRDHHLICFVVYHGYQVEWDWLEGAQSTGTLLPVQIGKGKVFDLLKGRITTMWKSPVNGGGALSDEGLPDRMLFAVTGFFREGCMGKDFSCRWPVCFHLWCVWSKQRRRHSSSVSP